MTFGHYHLQISILPSFLGNMDKIDTKYIIAYLGICFGEGDATRSFFVTRIKDGKEFIVERVHHSVSDTQQDYLYVKNGKLRMDSVSKHRKECREISTTISKFLEMEEEHIEISIMVGKFLKMEEEQ